MTQNKHEYLLLLNIIILCALLTSCPPTARIEDLPLEKVAKNWCAVLRASQVIPVYPITEDIKPGDIFLVEDTIDKEVEKYNKDGYLPLDLLIKRLNPGGYIDFYTEGKLGPWQTISSLLKKITGKDFYTRQNVAFPGYSFTVNSNSRLGMALPIFGKQLTFGALNIEEATVSVDISNAYTYGLDYVTLNNYIATFQDEPKTKTLLKKLGPKNGKYLYLRIVGRVYVADKITVTIKENKAKAAGASVDEDNKKPSEKKDSTSELKDLLNKGGLVNAEVKQIQEGTIGIISEFPKPLVFGYLAYDVKILCEGELSEPISTLSRLDSELDIRELNNIVIIQKIYDELAIKTDSQAIKIKDKLNQLGAILLPDTDPFITCTLNMENGKYILQEKSENNKNNHSFQAVLNYIGRAKNTIDFINIYAIKNKLNEAQVKNLQNAKEAFNEIICFLSKESTLFEAIDLVLYNNSK